jgi:hypothetical protein
MTTKISLNNLQSSVVTAISAGGSGSAPKISSITYPGDDTAAATAGGQTITLTGSGFTTGASVIVNGSYAGVVTVVSNTSITFTAPANSGGTYPLYVVNTDGGTAISIPGISYSGTPSWSNTAGSLATVYETAALSTQLTATGNLGDGAITYSVYSGTLPPGSSLNTSTGLLSGTTQATASSTTYTFTIRASDAQNQDTDRAFSITINPDVVTWSSPADGTVTELFQDTAMSNVTLSATSAAGQSIAYTANALPTGVTISGSNVTGTPTVLGNTISVITATAANTNRTATRTFTWVVNVSSDQYFKNTILLLNGETTVTPFISDASTNSFGLTIQGDTKPVLFNPYTPGYYSNYFDGTGDYLANTTNNTALAMGSGNFTIEFWMNASNGTIAVILDTRISTTEGNNPGGMQVYHEAGTIYFYGGANTSNLLCSASITYNTWNHVAIVRSGSSSGNDKMYINGSLASTYGSADTTNYSLGYLNIGTFRFGGTPSTFYTGYISNLRIVKGTAVYTSNFTPSTTPLTAITNTSLLTCQSNRLIDNSTNAFTITKNGDVTVRPAIPFTANSSYSTYGSTYFDGTGDYLTVAANAAFTYGTSNFTIEGWHYLTAASNVTKYLFDQRVSGQGLFPAIYISSGSYIVYINSGVALTAGVVVPNVWVHWALVKNSSTTTLYINGTSAGSFADTNNYSTTALFRIGSEWSLSGSFDWQGYMSDLRVVKGTALYTANFTPPTSPLTAIANTSLLTLQYNGGATNQGIIDNSNFNNIITRNANTSQGTFSPYSQTGWSNYFNGTSSQWISFPAGANTAGDLGAGDFTLECWTYLISKATLYPTIFDNAAALGNSNRIALWVGHTSIGTTTYNAYFAGTNANFSTSIIYNAWTHLALVRSGTTIKLFVNGIQDATTFTSAVNFFGITTAYIGGSNGGAADSSLNGYISNFRIVKGTALYTSTFTPPTTPLTAISGTSLLTCQSNQFVNNGSISATITPNGVTSVQAFDPFGSVPEAVPISYSVYFDGTGDYLQTPTAVFGLGTIFTVEAWVYPTELVSGAIIFASTASGEFSLGYNGTTRFGMSARAVAWLIDSTTLPTLNAWNHIVVSRGGLGTNQTSLFINGVRVATATVNNAFTTMSTWQVGYDNGGGGGLWKGNISNLRVVAGTDVYGYTNTTLTSPSAPLTAIANTSLLTCQSTRMIDNSTNNFTLTAAGDVKPRIFNPFGYTAQSTTSYNPSLHGGSAYFDGSGDYLSASSSTAFAFGSGVDFTVEGWVYLTSYSPGTIAGGAIIGTTNGATTGWFVNVGENINTLRITSNASGSWADNITVTSGNGIPLNVWTHIAFVRNGGSLVLYKNGVSVASMSGASAYNFTSPNNSAYMGYFSDGSVARNITGYISDVHVVKGTAVYTTAFIPPTAPLTPITNTSLLLNFNNGGIIDQHGTNVIETVGNAQLSTVVKKYNNASMYFDGTGDYLTFPSNPTYTLGTGDFTIECWAFANTGATNRGLFQISATAGGFLGGSNSLAMSYYYGNVNGYVANTTVTGNSGRFTANAWHHIAVSRSSGVTRVFIDGLLETNLGTSGAITDTYSYPGTYLVVGGYFSTSYPWLGYIDDFRITKGYARYTSNFTPPTAALKTK